MKNIAIIIPLIVILFSCQEKKSPSSNNENLTTILTFDPVIQSNFKFYSKTVNDTFKIFVSLPKGYEKSNKKYPVVYVLDANIAFDMVSTISKLLSVGIECKEAIYIGVGYKDIMTMDSLRGRDYSFPPDSIFSKYGANVFSKFLKNELIPEINNKYKTIQKENTIIGHSLSGYFIIYNLLQSALNNDLLFKNYIAGSPFLGKDNPFIGMEQKLSNHTDSLPIKLFMCSGTNEDTDSIQLIFTSILKKRNYKGLEYKSIILNDFDHMDALIPTWSKGLRYVLGNK